MMAADCLEALGIKRGDYVIKVNNRKVLDGVMDAIGLGGPENAERRLTVLRAIDKLDRLGPDGVQRFARATAERRKRRFHQGRANLTSRPSWSNYSIYSPSSLSKRTRMELSIWRSGR